MSAALLLTGLFLALFGVAFVALGLVNERSYWSQRDPSAAPGSEGVRLPDLVRQAWPYALRAAALAAHRRDRRAAGRPRGRVRRGRAARPLTPTLR